MYFLVLRTSIVALHFLGVVWSDKAVLVGEPEDEPNSWHWTRVPLVNGWARKPGDSVNPTLRYEACSLGLDSSKPKPNSWLISQIINVYEAKRIDVTMEYRIPLCSTFPNNGGFHCVNVFDLYLTQSDQASQYPDPITNKTAYEKVTELRYLSSDRTFETTNIRLKGKYVFLAFHNYGACCALYSVKVTYNVCPGQTLVESLVSLPRTVAPANDSMSIPIQGHCADDSVKVPSSLHVYCESTGEWNTSQLNGRCICKENMQNVGGKCQDCPDGKYNDQKGLNCTDLPSAPNDVNATFVNQSAVELSWQPPEITGDQSHVFYDVHCLKLCNNKDDDNCVEVACGRNVSYIPGKEGLNDTQVMVVDLLPFVNYTIKIYARNRVSEVAQRTHGVKGTFALITVRTIGSIPGKPEVSVKQAEVDTVSVSWILEDKNGVIKHYNVTYIRADDSSDSRSLTTRQMRQDFEDLKDGKTYEFQVYAVNNFGKGPTGAKKFTLRKGGTADKLVVPLASAGGGLLFLLLVVVIIVILVLRRRKRSVEKAYMRSIEQGGELDQRRYIDPANYADLMELLSTFTTEMERSKAKLEELIGQGEFADVYKGTIKTGGRKDIVAVKVLRPGSSEKSQRDFLSEASIVAQFNHPNVIKLVGVVTQSRPMMILTEFMESGSLDNFLKSREGNLTSLQLVGMARGVACGMVYLSEMSFIHRDLAARNILVGENMSCKVSDFGLSRELQADDNPDVEYETQGGKIAVRWTAPEALQHRKFSTASDVWSYGIVLWEIMSFSDRPYWDWTNVNVIKRVTTGYRLPATTDCPKVVHSLMMDCWESDKNKRPKFAEIVSRLDEIIRSSQVLQDVAQRPETTSVKYDVPEFESVEEWLHAINMENYSEIFQAANIDNLEEVTKLEEQDLKEMGVKLIGHRKKMNKSIKSMKRQSVNRGLAEDEAAI